MVISILGEEVTRKYKITLKTIKGSIGLRRVLPEAGIRPLRGAV